MNPRKKIFDISVVAPNKNKTVSSRTKLGTNTEPDIDSRDDVILDETKDTDIYNPPINTYIDKQDDINTTTSYEYQPKQYNNGSNDEKSAMAKFFSIIANYLIVPALIVWFMLSFIFQPFYVSGKSMEPSLHDKDYLIISKISLSMDKVLTKLGKDNNHPLKRGDIVVFRYPAGPSTFFIKRLIGMPGDRVVIKEGFVTIYNKQYPSGLRLDEKYINPQYKTGGDIDQVVPDNNYFVMGDNRSSGGSFDSRNWGMLPKHYVVGSMLIRLMPSIKIGSLN